MTWWWAIVMALHVGVPGRCESELVELDRTRALAFAAADPAALQQVYLPDSPLLTADAEALEGYRGRGGRVVGAMMQVSSCRELRRDDGVVRLEVADALGPAVVQWDDGTTDRLPRDRPTRREVTLRMTPDGWRIAGSQPAPAVEER